MQATKPDHSDQTLETNDTSDFPVTIVHDTTHNAVRALKVCDRLIADLGREFMFNVSLCDATAVHDPGESDPAGPILSRARIVFVAMDHALPRATRTWLEDWAAQGRSEPRAIAVLQREDALGPPAVAITLADLCIRNEIDLIVQEPHETFTKMVDFRVADR